MKAGRIWTEVVLAVLVLGCTFMFPTFCVADDPDPNLPSEPTVQTVAVPILEVPYTITESGSYCLIQNLTHTDRYSNAIVVEANNVTIDLGGYSLIGPTTSYNETCSGIYMDMRSNVEIRNGTITNFPNRGIFADNSGEVLGSTGIRIVSIRVTKTGAEGIVLWGYHHTVMNCTVTNTEIEVEQGHGGITCASFCSVTGNVVSRHAIFGIQTGSGCTIRNNTVGECSYGIVPGDGCSVTDNTIFFAGDGMWISDAAGCMIRGNTIRECQGNGINIEGFDNAIEGNLVTSCEVGFYFAYNQNVYANNRALYNGTNYGGQVPSGIYDGGGNIGAGTFVGGNVGAKLRLKAKVRVPEKPTRNLKQQRTTENATPSQ
jgi:parallel beta-helix repeat protein